eukprot:364501-Chlamydomonas_euryale.AAC.5
MALMERLSDVVAMNRPASGGADKEARRCARGEQLRSRRTAEAAGSSGCVGCVFTSRSAWERPHQKSAGMAGGCSYSSGCLCMARSMLACSGCWRYGLPVAFPTFAFVAVKLLLLPPPGCQVAVLTRPRAAVSGTVTGTAARAMTAAFILSP